MAQVAFDEKVRWEQGLAALREMAVGEYCFAGNIAWTPVERKFTKFAQNGPESSGMFRLADGTCCNGRYICDLIFGVQEAGE